MGSSPVPPGFFFPIMTKTDIANRALAKLGQKRISSIDDPNDKSARLTRLAYGDARDELLRAGFWSFAMTGVRLDFEVAATSYVRTVTGIDNPGITNGAYNADWVYTGLANGKSSWATGPLLNPPIIWWTGTQWKIEHPLNDGVIFTSDDDVESPELVETWTAAGVGSGAPVITTLMDDEVHPWSRAFALPAGFLKLRKVTMEDSRKIDRFEMRRVNGKRCLLANADEIRMMHVDRLDDPDEYDPAFCAALATLLAAKVARAITGSDELETKFLQMYESIDLPAARTADGHDSQSDENHPLQDLLDGDLIGRRGTA